ncbi:MAG: methylenetetrahydrofolate reductase [Desulfuromonadales bacterium]|nr:methylenetetrahydrofolate reductase [Desulfuromonadales bacterium]MBN2793380.1 methylenetetrahydrofolate reductase [Desulfuromonadales bacterium]
MSGLAEKLKAGRFVITAEVAPPKGGDVAPALKTAEKLKHVDAINVTDNQGACMRMSPVAVARCLVEEGFEPILQLTCRDRNRMALQSELLGAAALGIKNLLVLTGDHPRFGDHKASRPVFDLDSIQLLQGIRKLESGFDMAGNALISSPGFFVGTAAAPAAEPQDLVLQKIRKKIAAGTDFFQTQAVFSRTQVAAFSTAVRAEKIPVVLGVVLLKSLRMAEFLNDQIPGVQVPQDLLKRLDDADDSLAEGVKIAREMVTWARDLCQGVHLMTFGREDLIPQIMTE